MQEKYFPGVEPVGGSGLTTTESMRLIASVGFGGTFTGWNHEKTEKWANTAAKCGLIYQSIHSPFSGSQGCRVSELWEKGKAGKAVADKLIACVEDCARFDIPVMVIHPFIGFEDHTPTQVGLDNYRRVVEVANKLGVTLGFENVEGEEYLAALMREFWNEPCCGFCLDTGHEQCYNEGKDMLALYGEKLCHTHFNDNLGVYDPKLTWENDLHLLPYDGIVDFEGVMARIEKTPYRGLINFELTLSSKPGRDDHKKYRDMGIEAFYATAYERACRILAGK